MSLLQSTKRVPLFVGQTLPTHFDPLGVFRRHKLITKSPPSHLPCPGTRWTPDKQDAGWTALGAMIEGSLGFRGGRAGLTLDQSDGWQFTMPSTGQVQIVVTTYDTAI